MNELTNITPVVIAVLTLCFSIITVFVIPWIKAKIELINVEVEQAELEKIWKWMDVAIKAAEQLAEQGRIEKLDKYQYVANILAKHGFKLDEQDVEVLIEGFCHELPKWFTEGIGITGEVQEMNSNNTGITDNELDALMNAISERYPDGIPDHEDVGLQHALDIIEEAKAALRDDPEDPNGKE